MIAVMAKRWTWDLDLDLSAAICQQSNIQCMCWDWGVAGNKANEAGNKISGAASSAKDKASEIIPQPISDAASSIKESLNVTGVHPLIALDVLYLQSYPPVQRWGQHGHECNFTF